MFKLALVGQANSGKTTLFNALTNSKEKVGNFHGVTATISKSAYKLNNTTFEVADLPGIYSLVPRSLEEQTTTDYLIKGQYDYIICLIDGLCPLGALELILQLKKLNKPIIVGVTKLNLLKKRGGYLDLEVLEKNIGVTIVEVNAKSSKSVLNFKRYIENFKREKVINFSPEKTLRQAFTEPKPQRLEKLLLNPFWCMLICVVIFWLVFFLAFSHYSIVSIFSAKIEVGVEVLSQFLTEKLLTLGVTNFVASILQKTINSTGIVLAFLPKLLTLNFCMLILEESGVASRYSIILSNLLNKGGLNGKSVFPLISGLGCSAISCKLCNASQNEKVKGRTLACLPFVPCSAKSVVFLFLCSLFTYPTLALICVYLFNILALVIYAWLAQRLNPIKSSPQVLELAPLAIPNIKSVVSSSVTLAISFFKKIILSVSLVSLTLAVLTCLDSGFNYTNQLDNSLLAQVGKVVSPIFKPIGFSWEIVLALLCGLFAKETTIGTITMLYGNSLSISMASLISLIVFFSLYSPCFIALACFNKESKWLGVKIFVKHTLFGYIGALFVYNLLTKRLVFSIIMLCLIVVGWLVYEKFYCRYKRKIISPCGKARGGLCRATKTISQKGREN